MKSKCHWIVMSINTNISIAMANYASLDAKVVLITHIISNVQEKKKEMPRKRLLVNLNLASYNTLYAYANNSNAILPFGNNEKALLKSLKNSILNMWHWKKRIYFSTIYFFIKNSKKKIRIYRYFAISYLSRGIAKMQKSKLHGILMSKNSNAFNCHV